MENKNTKASLFLERVLFWTIGAPLYVLFLIVTLPIWIQLTFRENKFRRKMRKASRFIEWKAIEIQLQSGEGVLLFESPFTSKNGFRYWWTNESVLQLAPTPPPGEDCPDWDLHPFIVWSRCRYTNEETGTAKLTNPPFSGWQTAKSIRRRYEKLTVINV